jgi:hypothetical protein
MKFTSDVLYYSQMGLKYVKFLFVLLELLADKFWFSLGEDLLRLSFHVFEVLFEFV